MMEVRDGVALVDEAHTDTDTKTCTVTFLRSNSEPVTVVYEPGVTPYHDHGKEGSLLDIALNFGFDLEHSCGGNCACTTCHVIVKEGEDNLTEMDEDEEDRLYMADGLTLHSRLGCQCVVTGDVTVEIPDVLDFIRHGPRS
ncbi:MAG TPA: 2Fe-2S iron-sulfur cluster-binding protein [Blastocatellia bacterium]|nr:2Fe-2S iron-sulfur cluster-binding protein [Blastocatellia bacterium]